VFASSRAWSLAALLATLALTAPAAARAERIPGIDVSRFDDEIRWQRVADAGVEFAFVQASRGSGDDCPVKPRRCGRDGFFRDNVREARAAGLRVGAYHRAFADDDAGGGVRGDARAEARLFANRVGELRPRDLLPVLDVEPPYGDLAAGELREWIRTWLAVVEQRLGAKPMIYTSTSGWSPTGDTTEFARDGHPLWIAHWGVATPSVPAANWAGEGWSVWQHTSDGHVPGVHGRVDRDWLRGGFRRLRVAPRRASGRGTLRGHP
jgi:GH25 family lysozyme M1 (1,4-beta-N-acetylmuramidase)